MTAIERFIAAGDKPAEDAVLICMAAAAKIADLEAVLTSFAARNGRIAVVVASAQINRLTGLRNAFPDVEFRQPRLWGGPLSRLVLTGTRARAILRIGDATERDAFADGIERIAERRGAPVVRMTLSDEAEVIVDQSIRAMGMERGDGPMLDWIGARLRLWLIRRPRGMLSHFARRVTSCDALSARLGHPDVIMCLGNGPSSVDPALKDMPHDALFRTNHMWMNGGFMIKADAIFTGVKRSMIATGRTLTGVATARKEQALLLKRVAGFWRGPFTYFVVEDVAGEVAQPLSGPFFPTTGAYMIAAAVALQPKTLIVAGMDMFSGDAGPYPGATSEANAYTQSHSYDTDAAFMRRSLSSFQGEIITLSKAFEDLAMSTPDRLFTVKRGGRGA